MRASTSRLDRAPAAAPTAPTAAAWMNSRRRRYSFLSVISDERMSGARFSNMESLLFEL